MSTAVSPVEVDQVEFIPPRNFHEMFERDPHYIERWLLSKKCPQDLLEDFTHDMYVHLMSATKACRDKGYEDRVATYDPELRGGSTIRNPHGAWGGYMNLIMTREYGKMIKRHDKSNTRGPNIISIDDQNNEGINSKISLMDMNGFRTLRGNVPVPALDQLMASVTVEEEEQVTTKLFMAQFLAFLEEEDPQLANLAQAIMYSDDHREMLDLMGLNDGPAYVELRRRLRDHAAMFLRHRYRLRLRLKRVR